MPSPWTSRVASLADGPLPELGDGLGRGLLQRQGGAGRHERPGPLEEPLQDPLQFLCFREDVVGGLLVAGALQELPLAPQHRQPVLHLVGDAGGHLPDLREPFAELGPPLLPFQLGDVLELDQGAHLVRRLDPPQPPSPPATIAAPAPAGHLGEGFVQPGKGLEDEAGLQSHHAGPHPQELPALLVQGRQPLLLVHPEDAEGQRVQEPLVDGPQLAQAGGQLAPLLQALGHGPQQDLLGIPPDSAVQLVPAHDEQQDAQAGQPHRETDKDPDERGVVHERDLTTRPRSSGRGPSGS